MLAIPVIRRRRGRFLLMVPMTRALTGGAAGRSMRPPGGASERRVKQYNHRQADACGNRTAAMGTYCCHAARGRKPMVMHYSVKRPTLRTVLNTAVCLPPNYRPVAGVFG